MTANCGHFVERAQRSPGEVRCALFVACVPYTPSPNSNTFCSYLHTVSSVTRADYGPEPWLINGETPRYYSFYCIQALFKSRSIARA